MGPCAIASLRQTVLLSALLSFAGCSLNLELSGGAHLNPRPVPGRSSSSPGLLVVLAIQLKYVQEAQRQPLLDSILRDFEQYRDNWESVPPKPFFSDALKRHLAAAPTMANDDRPRERFTVVPGKTEELKAKYVGGAFHLLVIALGVVRGPQMVRLLSLDGSLRQSICFDEYNVYVDEPGQPWPCPRKGEAQ